MPLQLGPVKKHVRAAAEEISAYSGITAIGGWRATGSVPGSDHPKGLAIDVMIKNRTQGDSVAAYVISNAERFAVTYIIWYERQWQDGKWVPYSHPGGNSDTLAHRDHVHVSFAAIASGIGGAPVMPDSMAQSQKPSESGEVQTVAAILLGAGGLVFVGFIVLGVVGFVLWKGVRR